MKLGNLNNVYFNKLNINSAGLVTGEGQSDDGNFSICFRMSAGSTRREMWDYLEEAGEGLTCDMEGGGGEAADIIFDMMSGGVGEA